MQTPVTLLERLRESPDPDAWERFAALYVPLMFDWLRGASVPVDVASDLVQEVFVTLLRVLPEFEYDRSGGFRKWLRTVVLNRWRDSLRRNGRVLTATEAVLEQLADPESEGLFSETEYRRQLLARALQLIRPDFGTSTFASDASKRAAAW